MKVVDGMTRMIGMPAFELWNIIDAIEAAEKTADTKALQWCARRLLWFYEQGEVSESDKFHRTESFFNDTYAKILERDPPPKSIAGFIEREDREGEEAPDAADAHEALDTLKAFLMDSLGGKSFKVACTSLYALREAVKKSEAE